MNIRFPDVDEHYIKAKVDAGFYMNETELVRDAVRHMREEDERKNQFLSAIKVGQDQVASGQHRELTPDVLNELRQTATRKIQVGHKPKSDVLPE
ncbi:ribbon-helix-helix domain-containing protein [Nitrospira sp. M1]